MGNRKERDEMNCLGSEAIILREREERGMNIEKRRSQTIFPHRVGFRVCVIGKRDREMKFNCSGTEAIFLREREREREA